MPDQKIKVYPVLLAGGSGTRLWPVSRELYPKQLVSFTGDDSLVQGTIKRLSPLLDTENVRIVCANEHFHEIERQIKEIGIEPKGKIICEPCGRNTGPAIFLSVLNILKTEKDAVLCVFPADHVIKDIKSFQDILRSAVKLANMGYIVTFGIKPNYPETGYGYIEGSRELPERAFAVKRFVEKPDKQTALKYVEAGNFFWNSGMFAFKASVISEEIKRFAPELYDKMKEIFSSKDSITKEEYELLPNLSIDYAVMEKTDKGALLPSDFGWSDIGSWKSLYDFLPKDENRNVINGDVIAENTKNCFIMGHNRLIAANYISGLVVVDTQDSVFISDIENSREVKSIVERLKNKGRKEYHKHKTVYHPWGSFTLLEQNDNFKAACLIIYKGLKYETENDGLIIKHLIMVKGRARILTESQSILLNRGKSVSVFEKGSMIVENDEQEPICLVKVEIRI